MENQDGLKMVEKMAQEAQGRFQSEIVAVLLDNELHDLQRDEVGNSQVDFVEVNSSDGWRVYQRSVLFLLITAVSELYPGAEVVAQFSANKGLFCEVKQWGTEELDEASVRRIEQRMRDIVAENRRIRKVVMSREEAVRLCKESKQIEKANLISSLGKERVSLYYCGKYYDYLYGPMLGWTGHLGKFALDVEPPGVLIRVPRWETGTEVPKRLPQPKFSNILSESKRWAHILNCKYVTDLNRANRQGHIGDVIRISEGLQEKRIAQIADHIASERERLRLILIAGPSSSGKTSFAQRLRIQLLVNGLLPVSISIDDYFKSHADTPRNEKGEYDFESLEALRVDLFNQQMLELLAGKAVTLPRYNFITGTSEWQDVPLSVRPDQPIIVEGLHGLNEKFSESVPHENKYKIYVSALTQLNIDAHNRIPTTDARLLRRLVRDYQFRGSHALKTLRQWPEVRAGEEKYIFPYQEQADVMFNTALIYELGILKKYAVPLLEMVPPEVTEHRKARQLLDFCQYFDDIGAEDEVPNNSLLREFIGKSVFFK